MEGKYREGMKQYLEIGAMTSNMFSFPVPFHAWDEQVIHFESLIIDSHLISLYTFFLFFTPLTNTLTEFTKDYTILGV